MRKDDRKFHFSYFANYEMQFVQHVLICLTMLVIWMKDMAQNQKKFRFTTETLIERYVLAVLVFE